MCTMGMLCKKEVDEPVHAVMAKTVDTFPTAMFFGKLRTGQGGGAIAFSMKWQQGVNAGLNGAGLAVMSSYLGRTSRLESGKRKSTAGTLDTRGLANGLALDRCATVEQAVAEMADYLELHPSSVSGVHFLLDRNGTMGIIEHDGGDIAFRIAVAKRVLIEVRANDSRLLDGTEETEQDDGDDPGLSDDRVLAGTLPHRDRRLRAKRFRAGLAACGGDRLSSLKRLLGSHQSDDEGQIGRICVHDFDHQGARGVSPELHSTAIALILDPVRGRMLYSDGPPCGGRWRSLFLR